ncbi:hypothetical protein LX36DRAFT_708921 [Colletotrichum falcatum]|nr:hypothetical protein LX36DRAFT_708921 [Colletotrichum falcatum]
MALFFATAFGAESWCGHTPDCCWRDLDICAKKVGGGRCYAGTRLQTEAGHFCEDHNVTLAECDAGCCSVSRKVGIGCGY